MNCSSKGGEINGDNKQRSKCIEERLPCYDKKNRENEKRYRENKEESKEEITLT